MRSSSQSLQANEIRLRRQLFSGAFLVVEGTDDRAFMASFSCSENCRIEVARGKENVCNVIKVLEDDSFKGVLGLVDADFDRIDSPQCRSCNVLMSDFHDIETMLVCSPALERVLAEFGSQKKIDKLEESVPEVLFKTALPVGYLRLHSLRNRLELKFGHLDYSAWIDRRSLESSTMDLIEEVKNRSQRHDLCSKTLEAALEELKEADHNPREICNGKDLIEILSLGLRGKLGSNSALEVKSEVLRRSLRFAYSEQNFTNSDLYKEILQWEDRSQRFKVLRM